MAYYAANSIIDGGHWRPNMQPAPSIDKYTCDVSRDSGDVNNFFVADDVSFLWGQTKLQFEREKSPFVCFVAILFL